MREVLEFVADIWSDITGKMRPWCKIVFGVPAYIVVLLLIPPCIIIFFAVFCLAWPLEKICMFVWRKIRKVFVKEGIIESKLSGALYNK